MTNDRKELFIEGRVVYLRKPDIQQDVLEGEWHHWFNDMTITRYLEHGVFPVSRDEEANIVQDQLDNKSSFVLSIVNKASDKHIGVILLKSINLINRNAEIAIVMGFDKVFGAAIEAMALMTEHAFNRVNLLKLYAGQHEGLWKWVNTLELIGYKIEGYMRQYGVRDGKPYGAVLTSITSDDFYRLQRERGNILTDSLKNLIEKRRKENLIPKVKGFFEELYNS